MGARGPRPTDEKRHIMAMLRLGEFTSLAEAADLAGVTPQRVGQWCRDEKLDWLYRRKQRLKALWLLALRRVRRGKPGKRMTKDERRAQTERLVAEFQAKQAGR